MSEQRPVRFCTRCSLLARYPRVPALYVVTLPDGDTQQFACEPCSCLVGVFRSRQPIEEFWVEVDARMVLEAIR